MNKVKDNTLSPETRKWVTDAWATKGNDFDYFIIKISCFFTGLCLLLISFSHLVSSESLVFLQYSVLAFVCSILFGMTTRFKATACAEV